MSDLNPCQFMFLTPDEIEKVKDGEQRLNLELLNIAKRHGEKIAHAALLRTVAYNDARRAQRVLDATRQGRTSKMP